MSDTNQQTIQAYEQGAQEYIAGCARQVGGLEAWIDLGFSDLPSSAKILEVGTASGQDADYIESKGFSLQRSDAAKSFVEMQRALGHNARVLNLLTEKLGEDYDVIFANAVLLHFTETEFDETLTKIHDALKPGGRFLFTLKQGDGEEHMAGRLKSGMQRYFHYWQAEDIEHKLARAGFRKTTITVAPDTRGGARPNWLCVISFKKDQPS
jgi:2-polyprenyl-3-methyl-5-hydroxy-6-metoxy-1,4-benzoquinol methylase